jgi:hypothetical protein
MNEEKKVTNSFMYKLGRFMTASVIILLWALTIFLLGGLGFALVRWILSLFA